MAKETFQIRYYSTSYDSTNCKTEPYPSKTALKEDHIETYVDIEELQKQQYLVLLP